MILYQCRLNTLWPFLSLLAGFVVVWTDTVAPRLWTLWLLVYHYLSLFCSSSQLQHTILFPFITSLHISLFLSWQLFPPMSPLVQYLWHFLSLISAANWNPAVSFCIWLVWAKCLPCQMTNHISIRVVTVIGKTIHPNPFSQVSPIFHFPLLVSSECCCFSSPFPSAVQHAF